MLTVIQDRGVGPQHQLEGGGDMSHFPKWLAGLILPDIHLQTNFIMLEAKWIPRLASFFFFLLLFFFT